jgi:16S rRNA (guanine527-N7)-methyltransferase
MKGSPDYPMKAAEFQAITGVSDDVLGRLQVLAGLLGKWKDTVNLVGPGTLDDLWRRHMLDSAQLAQFLPPAARAAADIGSGAGFPGLVLAIMARGGPCRYHLIESNERRCAFLIEANRLTQAGAIIHNSRIEKLPCLNVDVIVARAVAPLTKLLEYAILHLIKGGQCLFLKGRKWREELTEARKSWIMKESSITSLSDSSGVILKLEDPSRRDDR